MNSAEAICASDPRSAERFTAEIDSAVVAVNTSTAFTDRRRPDPPLT